MVYLSQQWFPAHRELHFADIVCLGWEVLNSSSSDTSPDGSTESHNSWPTVQSPTDLSPPNDDSTNSGVSYCYGQFANLERSVAKPKPWRNPNPSAEPIYATVSTNIFMRLQQRPIMNYTNAPMGDIQFSKPMPPPDDMDVHPIDSRYLTYFVTEVPGILGLERFFPSAITAIFKQSINQPILRHSILAVSSWIMNNRQGRPPLYTLRHLQRILPGIQNAIMALNINTAHIFSVTFLAWLSLMTGDLYTTHRHLKGLFLMFLNTRQLSLLGEPYNNSDPMTMFLYRMSIKIDNTLAYRNFPPAYPPIANHESYHRQWLPHFISKPADIDDCLAAFQLDDFTNQICHLHQQTKQLKQDNCQETEIQGIANTISDDLTTWLSIPAIKPHIPIERSFGVMNGSPRVENNCFLHYPLYPISDLVFAQMLLIHASLGIHLSIVTTGKLGPYPPTRYELAVQVCRIYASMGPQSSVQKTGQSRTINALWLAGLVLGNDCYPAGALPPLPDVLMLAYQWIATALLELDRDRGYRAPSKLVDALNETWAQNGEVDAWETVGRIFNINWEVVRNGYTTDGNQEDFLTEGMLNDTEWKEAVDLEVYS